MPPLYSNDMEESQQVDANIFGDPNGPQQFSRNNPALMDDLQNVQYYPPHRTYDDVQAAPVGPHNQQQRWALYDQHNIQADTVSATEDLIPRSELPTQYRRTPSLDSQSATSSREQIPSGYSSGPPSQNRDLTPAMLASHLVHDGSQVNMGQGISPRLDPQMMHMSHLRPQFRQNHMDQPMPDPLHGSLEEESAHCLNPQLQSKPLHEYVSPALDPIDEIERELEINRRARERVVSEDRLTPIRIKYKPRSSIPPNLSDTNYAAQCTAAAVSSRMPPYRLHPNEHYVLRPYLPLVHVTTYLNIRNGILRLWLSNPSVKVTLVEAAGCVRDPRFYPMAEFAFEWLVRHGYINHGCLEAGPSALGPSKPALYARKKKRQTIAIIGAGIAGLSCARQLTALIKLYKGFFHDYDDLPRVVVLEARRRIGGRLLTGYLSCDGTPIPVDLGADSALGFGGGNPLGQVLRRQLGWPVIPQDPSYDIYVGESGAKVDPAVNYRAHQLFTHLLERMSMFAGHMSDIVTASGDKVLMKAGRDPEVHPDDEGRTIAEENDFEKPYGSAGNSPAPQDAETAFEIKFLQELGYKTKPTTSETLHVSAEPVESPSLGKTMEKFMQQLDSVLDLGQSDREALQWYYAKFEFLAGTSIDNLSLTSWNHIRENRFSGRHCWAKDGMASFARGLHTVPSKLDVRFKTTVKVIEYEEDSAQVSLENGDQVAAARVVCTVPLGVLKKRSMQFIPDLPQWKTDSIERLGFGVVNKVVLLFDKVFWEDVPTFRVTNGPESSKRGDCFLFQNYHRVCGKPVIIGLVSGDMAVEMTAHNDAEIVKSAVEKFKCITSGKDQVLVESMVTRWQLDPYTLGTYSHVGKEGTIVDHDLIGRPVHQSLFFAGEATSRFWPGTMHGAYLSGLRAAKEVINSMIGPVEVPENLILGKDFIKHQESSLRQETSVRASENTETSLNSTPTPHYPPPLYQQPYSSNGLPISLEEAELELSTLQHERVQQENGEMEIQLRNELGERPQKAERAGNANPFLLFQKDFWEVCRNETNANKTKGQATRNEIRVALGKRWKSLSPEDKQPFVQQAQKAKELNEHKQEEFLRRLKWYDSEADNFRQQWRLDHPSKPGEREKELTRLVEEVGPRRKRTRLRE